MDLAPLVEKLRKRSAEVELEFANPQVATDRRRFEQLSREYQRLKRLLDCWGQLQKCRRDLDGHRHLLATETDPDFRAAVTDENAVLEAEVARLDREVMILALPPDEKDSRNTIMEIRPGTGGEEAALFANELLGMYRHFAEKQGWTVEILHLNQTDLGGVKEVALSIQGTDCYRYLQYEGGVHRVQRVPVTETSGRVHTSTVTVAVLPEATEVDLQLKPEDLDFKVARSSGPGGQSVNTTDSAVTVTHLPTLTMVRCQQEKSQHKNKAMALRLLRSRLLERQQREEDAKYAADRRSQVGTGDRSERIRTYNFPQNRLTDHRFGLSGHNLPVFLGGDILDLLNQILALTSERRLAAELAKG